MKKIVKNLMIVAVCFASLASNAQSYYKVPTSGTRTITGVDTVRYSNVPSKIKSFQYTYTEISGTTAGKVYLEGCNDTTGQWKMLDSITLADVATPQSLIHTPTATSFGYYRFRNTNTSGATGAVRSVMLRRFDE